MLQYRYDELGINIPELSAHWDPGSEKFARGDQLITALYNGWWVDEVVVAELCEDHWFANGTRCVVVYHFTLRRDAEIVHMPVISTPYIERILAGSPLQIASSTDRVMEDEGNAAPSHNKPARLSHFVNHTER